MWSDCQTSKSHRNNMTMKWRFHRKHTLVTPWIIFVIKLLTVLRQATCFLAPCQTTSLIFLSLIFLISILMCLKFFVNSPRGPLTVTSRDLTDKETPSGISKSSSLYISFIAPGTPSQSFPWTQRESGNAENRLRMGFEVERVGGKWIDWICEKMGRGIFIDPSIIHGHRGMRSEGIWGWYLSSVTDAEVWRAKGRAGASWRGREVGDDGEGSLMLAELKFDMKC